MQLKAVRHGDGWILNGSKIFTTSAHFAEWYWVGARTDPDAPKHAGITLFLLPMNAPGLTVQGMQTIGEDRTNQVFFDNVYVGDDYRVGELGRGFDRDAEMIGLIESGRFSEAPVGRYLASLRGRFEGPIVADLLCYLRVHTELAMRAKGVLMLRESGFPAKIDEGTRARLAELRYLERSIGRTGMLALRPLVHASRKDVWQIVMLGG